MTRKKFNFHRWWYRWFGWRQKWLLKQEAKRRENVLVRAMAIYRKDGLLAAQKYILDNTK